MQPPHSLLLARRRRLRERLGQGTVVLARGDGYWDPNLHYLTGLDLYNCIAVIDVATAGGHVLVWRHQAHEAANHTDLEVRPTDDEPWGRLVSGLAAGCAQPAYVDMSATAAHPFPAGLYEAVRARAPSLELRDLAPHLAVLRASKDPWEIEQLRQADGNARAAMRVARSLLRPGITEREVAAAIVAELVRGGAIRPAMPIVAFGSHTAMTHHVPSDRALEEGAPALVDVYGNAFGGYACEHTDTVLTAQSSALAARRLTLVQGALERAEETLQPGVTLADLDMVAGLAFREAGAEGLYPGRCSHLVGLEEHDPWESDRPIPEDAVVALEPSLYDLSAGLGVRIERVYQARSGAASPLGPP